MKLNTFVKRLNQVIKSNDLIKNVKREAIRLAESGGIDLEKFDDFVPAKVCLHIALLNEANQYAPLSIEAKKVASNLKHF